jgi:flavodoxin
MKVLIVYESTYGNTERIAQVIGEATGGEVCRAGAVTPADLATFDLLVVGSPTHGGFPVEEVHSLLEASPALSGIDVAAFDTRTKRTIFGYAAPKIAKRLKSQGGVLRVPPEGFLMRGVEGPLQEGELERAAGWAQSLLR